MHPYREPWIAPITKEKPKKHPREIIAAAVKALDVLFQSCPTGLMITEYDTQPTNEKDISNWIRQALYGSPHSTRYTFPAGKS